MAACKYVRHLVVALLPWWDCLWHVGQLAMLSICEIRPLNYSPKYSFCDLLQAFKFYYFDSAACRTIVYNFWCSVQPAYKSSCKKSCFRNSNRPQTVIHVHCIIDSCIIIKNSQEKSWLCCLISLSKVFYIVKEKIYSWLQKTLVLLNRASVVMILHIV